MRCHPQGVNALQEKEPASSRRRSKAIHSEIFLVIFLIVASGSARAAGGSPVKKIHNGILVKVGQAEVEIAAATPMAFCLRVSYDGKPRPSSSIFLSDPSGRVSVPWQLAQSDEWVGVKTPAGELLINPLNGKWTLLDASGRQLISPSEIGKLSQDANPGQSHVTLAVGWGMNVTLTRFLTRSGPQDVTVADGWGKNVTPSFYGSGNGMGLNIKSPYHTVIGPESLPQTDAHPELGNGVASIPYYWCTAGYSALAVTGDDNQPASWKAVPDRSRVIWDFPGRTMDLYLMPAANLRAAAQAYAQLSGYPPVPPRWTFGYMQSRWGWKDRGYIEDTLREFTSRKFPLDALIFDVEWYTPVIDYRLTDAGSPDFKDFSWNPALFPDPAEQIAAHQAQGVRTVVIRKPRLGNSALLGMMREKDWGLADLKIFGNCPAVCWTFANLAFAPGMPTSLVLCSPPALTAGGMTKARQPIPLFIIGIWRRTKPRQNSGGESASGP